MCDCSRRRLLGGLGALGTATIAGCLGGDEEPPEPPDPVALDDGQECAVCGMRIAGGYGPNGQVAYDGSDSVELAKYDSVRELFVDHFDREQRGAEALVGYVTDYATADFEVEARNGDRYITGTVDPTTFVEATDAVFVVESGVQGAMGPDLLPFGRPADADAFVDEHGGRIVDFEDVTSELVGSL